MAEAATTSVWAVLLPQHPAIDLAHVYQDSRVTELIRVRITRQASLNAMAPPCLAAEVLARNFAENRVADLDGLKPLHGDSA